MASTAGRKGYAYVTGYCAAKDGVIGLTRALALETAKSGVTVNAICPGYTRTPMLERETIMSKNGRARAEAEASLLASNLRGRFIEPEEIAATVFWLRGAGEVSVTGQDRHRRTARSRRAGDAGAGRGRPPRDDRPAHPQGRARGSEMTAMTRTGPTHFRCRVKAARRVLVGSPMAELRIARGHLAEMATDADAAALLTYRAAWTKASGAPRVTREAAMAKLYAIDRAQVVIDKAVRIHGGDGVRRGHVAECLYREIRASHIYGGASDVRKVVIARQTMEAGR